MLLGVDVGGTFTDAVLAVGDRLVTAKAPTTPEDQSEGVLNAVQAVLEKAGEDAADVEEFAHGTTAATNALLEGEGAKTVFVATKGFEDIVELGRQARADLYRLCEARPAPLVPPELRVGAQERMTPDGPEQALDVQATVDAIMALEPESVAVCFLHAYRHPEHEQRARRGAAEDVHVSLSHQVVGTFREYERAATTEVDAALSPLLAAYLRNLTRARAGRRPAGAGRDAVQRRPGEPRAGRRPRRADRALRPRRAAPPAPPGPPTPRTSRTRCASTWAARAATSASCSAARCARRAGARSADARSRCRCSTSTPSAPAAARSPGATRAARCGSGRASAGARPGPAAYGHGGEEPTVTDANLLLGLLGGIAGGIELDREAAERRRRHARRRAAGSTGRRPPRASSGSPTPRWSGRCA